MPGNRKPMRYAHAEGHTDLCYSEDGAYILTCGIDGDVRIWLGLEDDDPKSQCVGEKALAVAHKDEHMYVGTDNNYVQSYTFPEPERDGISVHFTAPVTHISTCKTSSKIVCGSCDMQIQVYDTDTSQSFYLSGHMAPILGVALDPKEKFVVSSSCDGSVRVWSLENRGPVKTWHCLQKYNSFYAAKCLGRVAWQPGAALYLAVPEGLQVTVYHRDNWNVAMVFTEKRVQKPFSITAFSPCGDFLAASTIAGDICIWDVKLQCCVSFSVHDNGHSICALAWNPSGNGEIAYCDSIGQLGTVEECISKESSHVQKSEDGAIGDLYTSNVYDDDDEDGDHVISLNKIKADASQLAPRATTLLGLDLNDHSSLKAVDDDAASSVSTGIHTAEKITIQPPFQPTSTPTHLQHRFMVWNSVGIVRCYNTEDENSLDVEFHDTSLHHALHMNNYLKHSMASLSDQALVLACAADSDISSKLVCVLLSAWDGTREWSVDLPDGEEILAVATSAHWIAAATDTRNLRLFTLGGTQREIVSLSGPVVCLTGHKEWLLVVYHNGSGLSFTCLCVKDSSVEVCSPFQTLPLTPKCTLQWLGFSDEGTACTMDSSGMIRILSPRGYWVPLCDTRAQCKSKSDHYFVLGVSERYQNIRCVLCKCSHYPPTTPRPTVAEISTQLPLCETSSEKSGLEGKFLLAKMHCTALEAMSGTDHSYEEDKERAERTIKETVIKMFALACRSGLEHRALDLCQLMPSHQVVQLAVKYASKIGKMHLADRLLEVVANKMKEEEALALHKISSQDQFLQERNVWDNVNESTVSSTDVAQDNCLVGESDPFANTPDSESTENDNLLVDAKKREKSLLESGKTSGSQKRINPFKRNLKRTESGKGLENLISSFVQSHNSSSKTVGLKLTPQTEIITKIKQTSLCEKSLTSNKGNITFVQWFAQEKSSLQMEFPEMDVSELTRQGMKRYKELALTEKQERDAFVWELSQCDLPNRTSGDNLSDAVQMWREGLITNWEYLTQLNKMAGRSFNDLMQYPVFPFVLADYTSSSLDLSEPRVYRIFKRPMAVQDKKNEQHYINNYNYLKQELQEGQHLITLNQEPYHYGSHYSNSGTVLHFLVRLPPFTRMFLTYQDNNFDLPDRTFHSLYTTWRLTSSDSTTDVKEIIPEFFFLPEFLLNSEGFNFGVRQSGERVHHVALPPWCEGDPRRFILVHRQALESDYVRENLPHWVDMVFGYKQTGKAAVDAINVFHPATYYGFNVETIKDPLERTAWETMVKTYGQTPRQLFRSAHPMVVQSLSSRSISQSVRDVIPGVKGLLWGSYVGSPADPEPAVVWKHQHRTPVASLVPLLTNDVFGLAPHTSLLLCYSKEKGLSMVNTTSVLGAALVTWGHSDAIVRVKLKKEQPPWPVVKSSGLDPICLCASVPDCNQLWLCHWSGKLMVFEYKFDPGKGVLEFRNEPVTLLGHCGPVHSVYICQSFSVVVSGSQDGTAILWDLNNLSFVRSVPRTGAPVCLVSVSEALGDIATVCSADAGSTLHLYTINTAPVGSVATPDPITAVCFSCAPEGISVNVVAAGLSTGTIRLWSTWDLSPVREITSNFLTCSIISLTYSQDAQHLYASAADGIVVIWEGAGTKGVSKTPKFLNLTSL